MKWGLFKLKKDIQNKHFSLEPYKKRFYFFNTKFWKNSYKCARTNTFLVEGLLGEMPTHLFRLGVAAKAVEQVMNIKPVVVLKNNKDNNRKMFESFGIDEFVYLDEVGLNVNKKFLILVEMICFFIKCNANGLLNTKYKKINIGKLVYDSILHSNKDCYTIEKIEVKHIKYIFNALKYAAQYETLIEKNNVDLVLLSHNEYIEYGTLAVAALCQNKEVVTVNDVEVSKYGLPQELYWHKRFNSNIIKWLKKIDNKELQIEGNKYLNERIYGNNGLFDTKNAFGNKKLYTREQLREQFTHNDNKNVFIFMHVFSDAPHLSAMVMYKDYYDWITDTLKIIKSIRDVNWYIKVHPAAYLYGETEKIREILEIDNYDNIFFVPNDFNSASIKEAADAVVTCQGTVGIEAGCMGIPVIVTGKPFYADFGFTLCPKSKTQYYEMLQKCNRIKKLSNAKIQKAMAVMGAFNRAKYIDKTILDDEVYEYAGYGNRVDYNRAYNKIINNLNDKSYEDIFLYKKVKELLMD